VLRVAGVTVAVLEDLRSIHMESTTSNQQAFQEFRQLLTNQQLVGQHVSGCSMLEAYARTLCRDRFLESYTPAKKSLATVEQATQVVSQIVSDAYTYTKKDFLRGSCGERFINWARSGTIGSALYKGTGGYIGLAPSAAQVGDEVCVLLGCDTPMLLRPERHDSYTVVGSCFALGVSEGEALLGPLPKQTRMSYVYATGTGSTAMIGFVDDSTGEITAEDPRFATLSIDLTEYRKNLEDSSGASLSINPEALREHGARVKLRYFDLV
jgi:hypothetical protein